jgi:hypothetical protein
MALELDYSSAHADGHRLGSIRRAEFFRRAAMTSFMAVIPVKQFYKKVGIIWSFSECRRMQW